MKNILLILAFALALAACEQNNELPLLLPSGAEPSAKIHNDRGIGHYSKGKYFDALLEFTQASVADSTTGEIHFNIALMLHRRDEPNRAAEHFKLAKKYADGNKAILESRLLNQYLNQEQK
ncbi:hypothetical protein UR09_00330 [Candidatus Nitromaritima sp. SCGC AAA799-A02]|nr:hypothetical protein UR09_00330 [Candidatus Nitromaritima sp. SCGC AAA799-A02]